MTVENPITSQSGKSTVMLGHSSIDSGLLAYIRAERLARRIEAVTAASPKFGCLMLMLPSIDSVVPNWAVDNIANDDLAADGIETEPHITVLYGFNLDFNAGSLKEVIGKKPGIKLGKVTRFECPEYDVIKVDVISPDLEAINQELKEKFAKDITPSKHDYHPHLTIAYVKKGACKELDGGNDFNGIEPCATQMLYSLPEKQGRKVFDLVKASEPDSETTQSSHHETARQAAERIYKAAVNNWLSDLNAALIAAIFGHKMMDYDGVWLDVYGAAAGGWVAVMDQAARKAYAATAQTLGHDAGVTLNLSQDALEAFAASRKQPLAAFPDAVRDKLAASLKRGVANKEDARALARRANEDFGQIEQGAGRRVAATEAQVTYGVSQAKALELAGYRLKRWVTMGDDQVRDSHYLCESQGAVPVSAPFHNGLMFPGDPKGPPEEVINCRCELHGVE